MKKVKKKKDYKLNIKEVCSICKINRVPRHHHKKCAKCWREENNIREYIKEKYL